MANLINEAEIRGTWAPIIEEATGINESAKLAWMSTYCHNHKLYEDAQMMALNPNSPGSMNIGGMGSVSFPSQVGNGADVGTNGSGDKSPTLLPLAMQVAAQTIALDLVPVVPMAGPMGLLSYLDFVYEGGRLDGGVAPTYIKSEDANGAIVAAEDGYLFTKLAKAQAPANGGAFFNGMPSTVSLGCGTWGGNITTENISELLRDEESMKLLLNDDLSDLKQELYSLHNNSYNNAYENEVYGDVMSELERLFVGNITEEQSTKNDRTYYTPYIKIRDFYNDVHRFLSSFEGSGYNEDNLDYHGSYTEMIKHLMDSEIMDYLDFSIPDYPDYREVEKNINETA